MTMLKFIPALFLLLVSCNSNNKTEKNISTPKDSIGSLQDRTINKIDTTFYVPIRNGFYKTSKGNIYELKTSKGDDSLGLYTLYYLDSTIIVHGEYSNRKPLKEFIDISSYTEDTISDFSKDKNYVYYTRAQSDGHVRFIVEKANPKTFVGIKGHWGKDDRHIFYEAEIVKNADVKSFQVYKNSDDTARDKNHIYSSGEVIK